MEEMGKEEMQEKNNANKMLKEKVEDKIQEILVKNGITSENVDYLGKLMDIHKDLQEEECLKKKGELEMRYSEYDEANYGRRGVPGTGRGRYREGAYGRRGVPGTGRGRYRGNYAMDEMMENYENYSEASEESMRGNYGAEGEMVKSVEGIMKNIYEIVEELSETEVPEVEHIIKKYAKDFDKNITPHKLRHTSATLMFKHGKIDIRTLQKVLGHENISTTQIYTHVDDEGIKNAFNSNPLNFE